jgi:PAS domain S-box-containing protein
MKILLVEDNPGDARLVQLAFSEVPAWAIALTHVDRVAEAEERLAIECFDAILLDLSLPDSHGLATVERIRTAAPEAPIVVLTGFADDAVALQALHVGAQDYLPKGTDGSTLMRALRYAIERFGAERASQLAEQRYRDLFDDAPAMYVITRHDAIGPVVTDCNELFLHTLGYTRDEVINTPLATFYEQESRIHLNTMTDLPFLSDQDDGGHERRLLARDGREIDTALRMRPSYGADGAISGVHATFSDITALKQTEAALRHAKLVADEATANAETAYLRVSELHAELDAEFRRTAEIQAQLLPHAAPDLPGYEFAGVCLPARQVGGDFFDWLAGNDAIRISLGDVMGKGMPASLLTATVRAALRVVAHLPVSAAVEAVNVALSPDLLRSDSFVTLFHAALEPESGQLTYVDAGHGMAFIQRRNGEVEPLRMHNLPLGVLPDATYPSGTTTLEPGDTLVINSDGLPDARPELRLDAEGVAGQIGELPDAEAKLEKLVSLVSDIQTRPDDLTLVLLHRREDKDVQIATIASSRTPVVDPGGDAHRTQREPFYA